MRRVNSGWNTYVRGCRIAGKCHFQCFGGRAGPESNTHARTGARSKRQQHYGHCLGGFNRADRYVEQPLIWTSSCQRVGAHLLLMWVAHLIATFLVALSKVHGKILTCEMCGSFRSEGGPLTPAE